MGPKKYNGTFGDEELTHLLRRTLYNFSRSDLDLLKGKTLNQVVDTLLTPVPWPDTPPINNYEIEAFDPDVPKGQIWVLKANSENQSIIDGRNNSLIGWILKNMIAQEPRIQYKMHMFWHNHFGNSVGFVSIIKASYQYFRTLWQYSLGDFNQMVKAITIDPHMLLFLNGTANIREAPDENYARELQELFVIGKGPNAQFTESDVQEAARVLTGWGVDWETRYQDGEITSSFYDFQHEPRKKTFSAFYGNRKIIGRGGSAGSQETDELIKMLVEHPESARFITRKLYRYFIHNEISAAIEQDFIEPLAEVFIDSGFDMTELLKSMLTSEHFYSDEIRGALIKSPLDILIGFWRAVEMEYPTGGDALDHDYYTHLMMNFNMEDMGFRLGEPPTVSGWPAYHQAPSYDKLWLTTYSIISRIFVTDGLASDGFWTPLIQFPWDFLKYTDGFTNPQDPNELIDNLIKLHLPKGVSNGTKSDLKNILLSGQNTDNYWSSAWNNYKASPGNQAARQVVYGRLQFFYITFFQLPEFQLM